MDVPDPPSLEDSELFGPGNCIPSQTDPKHFQSSPSHSQAGPSTGPTRTTRKKAGRTFPATVSDSSGCAMDPSPLPSTSSTTVRTGRGNTGEASSETGREVETRTGKSVTSQQRSENQDRQGREWEYGVNEEAQVEEASYEQKQKSELRSLGLSLGFSKEDIENTLLFFDFSQQEVQPHMFFMAMDTVQAIRMKEAAEATTSAHSSAAAAAATSSEVATTKDNSNLRFIVIDGSNVAMSHGNDKVFSCRGIKICVQFFVQRGHQQIKVLVPRTKTYQNSGRHPPVVNQEILEELKEQGYLGYTPARTLNHKHIVSHDDPFILELAKKEDAVIVSNDNFREFIPEFRFIIENRVLSYVFFDNHFMLPRDPLGRNGPTLDQFLSKSASVPLRQAAVKGNANTQGLYAGSTSENAPLHRNVPPNRNSHPASRQPHPRTTARGKDKDQPELYSKVSGTLRPVLVVPPSVQEPLSGLVRPWHKSVTQNLFQDLKLVFPDEEQEGIIWQVLDSHCDEMDLNKLTNYCLTMLNM